MQIIRVDSIPQKNTHIGYFGEPKSSAFLAKAISFYARLLLFPFTVTWSESQRTYKLVPFNLVQKALWAVFVIGNVISFLFWVSTSVGEITDLASKGEVMVGILILVCLLLTWLSIASVIIVIWLRQDKIVQILRCIEGLDVLHLPSGYVWLCPILFYFASSVTNLSSTTGQITVSHGAKMMTDGILCVFRKLGWIDTCRAVFCRNMNFTLEAFFKLIVFHGGCFCSMPHTLLLSLCLGLKQIGNEVKRTLNNGFVSVPDGLRIYENVKEMSRFVHKVFGGVILTHYMCNLTYAIQTPFLFSEVGQVLEDVNYLLWLFVSGFIWWTGSEFHKLVHDAFKQWIQINLHKAVPMEDLLKLSILSNTIEKDTIGLYCRYFTVTHRFLTTTCGAVITYGIIVLQVQLKPASVETCSDDKPTGN